MNLEPPLPTETPRTVLRARSVGDVLDVIPSLLGFHPAESLVAVLIDEGRVKVTARLDLADAACPEQIDLTLEALLGRFPAADWLLVAYTADADIAWATLHVMAALLPPEVMVLGAVHVGAGRWFPSPDDPGILYDPGCSVLAAEAAYHGLRVLPDRSEIARCLEPVADRAAMEAALDQVIQVAPEVAVARGLRLAAERMRCGGVVTLEEAALLAVSAFSPDFAESIITGIDARNVAQARALWIEVVRSTTPFVGAAAAVILGVAAWVGGEGALQNVCLDRAEPVLADTPWFRLLELVNRTALPPDEWEGVRRDLLEGRSAA